MLSSLNKLILKKINILGIIICCIIVWLCQTPASAQSKALFKPLVNQAGYNTNEAKQFVLWNSQDNISFEVISQSTQKIVFTGIIKNFVGDFSAFTPSASTDEYFIKVANYPPSVSFRIAPFYIENISSKLAYDFFVDARGSTDSLNSNEAKVYSGGPTRDCGAFGLETTFETLFYASNPSLFDNWKKELGKEKIPDLIALILWHAEFAYNHVAYNGPVAERHGHVGYEGTPKMNYDYWNTLDHLAAVCAAYHAFLKPYLSEDKYQKYRKICLEKWTEYDRHKVVRYWTFSKKWVDSGYQEFNEMGNAFGQSVFSNLFMYLTELNEKNGKPEQFLAWAQESAKDIIDNWDFNNIRHMWWIRNAEHITPQALAFFLLTVPDKAPIGTKEKLVAWAKHIESKSLNPWHYRVHSDVEWAHPKTKELGGAPALGGSLFVVSYLLKNDNLRKIAWSQVNFVFGLNPLGAHLSNKSKERLDIGGYWAGVENGWPEAHPNGYGMLGKVRGTLDGTPLDKDFPRFNAPTILEKDTLTDKIGKNAYATEGWGISNRGWLATLTFSTLHSTEIKILDQSGKVIMAAKRNQNFIVELQAPLNIDDNKIDTGWVQISEDGNTPKTLKVVETGKNTSVFRAVLKKGKKMKLRATYGYWGFKKEANLMIQ